MKTQWEDLELQKLLSDLLRVRHPITNVCSEPDCPCCDDHVKETLRTSESVTLTLQDLKTRLASRTSN